MRTVNAMVKTFGLGFSLRCFASSTQRKKYVERENCLKSNKKKPLKNGEIWPHLKKKKITMIKPLNRQTNKGKKGRNLWLIKLLFYNEKNLNIFSKCFCSFLVKNYSKSTTTTEKKIILRPHDDLINGIKMKTDAQWGKASILTVVGVGKYVTNKKSGKLSSLNFQRRENIGNQCQERENLLPMRRAQNT